MGRIRFEALEQRVLLSADINPAFGALAVDPDLDAHLAVQDVGESYTSVSADAEIDLNATAVPGGTGPSLAQFDLTVLSGKREVPGSRVHTFDNDVALDEATTTGSFTLDLQAGQVLTLTRSDSGDLVSTLSLLDADSNEIASSTEADPTINGVSIADAGTYTVVVDRQSGAGLASVVSILNAVLEEEELGGDSNDTVETAQSLDASAIVSSNGGVQYSAIGDAEAFSQDVYSFDVTPGEIVSIWAAPRETNTYINDLRVLGDDGTELTDTNGYGYSLDAQYTDNILVRDGVNRMFVEVSAEAEYSIVVTRDITPGSDFDGSSYSKLNATGFGQGYIAEGGGYNGNGGVGGIEVGNVGLNPLSDEPDDTFEDANAVFLPVERYPYAYESGDIQNVDGAGDHDVYVVDLEDGDYLEAYAYSDGDETFAPFVRVFDETGTEIDLGDRYSGDDYAYVYGNVAAAGSYYVVVSGAGNETYDPTVAYSGDAGAEGSYGLDFYVERINFVTPTTYFSLDVVSGDEITLTTLTPDDVAGLPVELPSPVIEFGSSGVHGETLQTVDAGDGRNSAYSFTAQYTGTVYFSVHSESGEGVVQVQAEGSTASTTDDVFSYGSNLSENGTQNSINDSVVMYFNTDMWGGDADGADLLVNGQAANGATVSGSRVTFDIGGLIDEDGEYSFELVENGLSSLDGGVYAGRSFTVTLDSVGPSLESSSPLNGSVVDPGLASIDLTFSEDVNAFNLTPSNFTLVDGSGGTAPVISSVTRIDSRNVTLDLDGAMGEGDFTLSFQTGAYGLQDGAGNPFQTASIGFVVDSSDIVLDDMVARIGAPGLGSFGVELPGSLFDENDVDTYTFTLGEGQAATFVVSNTGDQNAAVALVDGDGNTVWTGTATDLANPATYGPVSDLAAGKYAIEVAGVTGETDYNVFFAINTDLEDEDIGGAANDSVEDAQAIEMLRPVGSGVTSTIVGTLNTEDAADYYSVTLAAGERLDVVSDAEGGTVQIALRGPNGDLITLGALTDGGVSTIGNFVAPDAGTYVLQVTSQQTETVTRYQLGLAVGVALQVSTGDEDFKVDGLSEVLTGLGGASGYGGNAKIAVVAVAGAESSFQAVVNQLNDSIVYNFDATLVYGVDVDTAGELDDYDLLILANTGSGQSQDAIGSVAELLPEWVESGGGVILTGWGVYGSQNETTAARAALNDVLPVNISSSYDYYRSSMTVINSDHPVTEGLSVITAEYSEYARGGLTTGSFALGGSETAPSIAVRELGLGRSVYLGPTYANSGNYGDNSTGAVDQLLEQAAAWAGGSNVQGQLTLDAVTGQEITLSTATPGDGAGLPGNDGDLLIRLYAPDGALVAENADGAADGRNALLSYTIPVDADGTYRIEVRAQDRQRNTDFLLTLDGNTQDVVPLMEVVGSTPNDGGPMQTGTNLIDIDFSHGVDITTIDLDDLEVDGDAIVQSAELLDGDTIRFTLSFPEGDKTYSWSMAAAAVSSISGEDMQAADGTFNVDETPPWVSETTPGTSASAPFNALTFVFDEAVDPDSVSIDDVASFTRPDGGNVIGNITSVEVNGAEVTVRFSDQYQDGSYEMVLGPDVRDMSGNLMTSPDGTQTQFTATVSVESPDLEVTNVSIPTDVQFGVPFDVTYTVTNTGDDPATSNWNDRIYLTNTSGTYLRSLATPARATTDDNGNLLPPLVSGASYTQTISVTVPVNSQYAEGDFRITVVADYYGAQSEAEENNNTGFTSTTMTYPPLVDLVVEPFDVPVGAVSGQELPITWTVTNTGEDDFNGSFYDRVYLSSGGTSLNYNLGTFIFTGPIAAGESVTRVQTVTLPDTLEGDWFVRILTDYYGNVDEGLGEDNNRTSSNNTVDITLRDFPNLIVTSVETPELAFSSAPITIEWTVQNVGEAPTNAPIWYDTVYLSLDDVAGNDDDIYLGRATNPSFLNADGSYRNSLTATLPEGIEGPYFINVRTDAYDYVEEFNDEDDNAASSDAFNVSLTPPPDLQVTNVVSPSQAFSGAPTTLTFTVTNEGEGRTLESAWYDNVWMSADDVLDGDDVLLGQYYHSGRLEADESYSSTVSVQLPVGVSGDFLFIVDSDAYDYVYEHVFEDNNTGFDKTSEGEPDYSAIVLTPPPDLEAFILDTPDPFYSGRSQTIRYEVGNFGATATLNSFRLDQVWMSDDDVLDESDVLVGQTYRYGVLQAGDFNEHVIGVTLPDGTLGDRNLILVTDADEREFEVNRNNNASLVTVDARILAADLAVTDLDVSDTGEAGGAISVGWSVENTGEGDTVRNMWSDQIVISVDDVYGNGDDRVLGVTSYMGASALAAGDSYSQEGIVTQLPFDLEGEYYVFLKADSGNGVYENGRETNNVSAAQLIMIERNAADLVASDVTFSGPDLDNPSDITAGRNLNLTYTVTNTGLGTTEATSWYDGVYLSLNDGLDPSEDIFIGRLRHVNRLVSGGSYNVDTTIFVPIAVAEGDYKVIVRANVDGVVSEEDAQANNNNAASVETLSVAAFDNGTIDTPPDGSDPYASLTPDLVVENVTASEDGFSGQPITVSWTVRNEGPQVTGPRDWYDTVYLSLDQNLDPSTDIRLGYVYHTGGLEVDESYDVTRNFTVPRGLAGDWFVYVRTDAGTSIGEVDDTNNDGLTDTPTSLVLPAPSDLVAASVTVPETGVLGAPVTFTYTVTNEGENAVVGRWVDSFYLSTDDTWSIEDQLITTANRVGPVASGESYTSSVTAALPGVLPGDYKIIVRSDIRNAVPESDENNNDTASEDTIAADAQTLELDTQVSGTIGRDQAIFFKITLPEDETVRVTLDREGDGASELYAAFGTVPTRSSFDASARDPFATDQIMTIPSSQPGEYYVMVFGQSGASSDFTLVAETIPFGLDAVDPTTVGRAGDATLRIEGARFSPDTTFELVDAEGTLIDAFDIEIVDSTLAFARFDMVGAPVGEYTLAATRGDLRVEAADAVIVTDALGAASMLVNVTGPDRVRPDRVNSFQVNFANDGGADARAPLILVTSSADLALGASGESLMKGGLQLLGSDIEGPVDVFRPGASSSVSVVYRTESSAAGVGMNARAITTDSREEITDFAAIERQIRPADLTDAEWNAFWTNLQPRIGTTWGQYVDFLNESAIYLEESTGETTRDVRDMIGQIYAFNPDYLPSVAVSGQLVDSQSGEPVGSVSLLAYRATERGFILQEITQVDAEGNYSFSALRAGTYELAIGGPIVDGLLTEARYGFDLDLDGNVDLNTVLVEVPEGQDTQDLQLNVTLTPDAQALLIARNPVTATDSFGRLHMVWSQDGALVHSVNAGSGWSAAAQIVEVGLEARNVQLEVRAGADGGEDALLVVWQSGELNESVVQFAAGARLDDGSYVFGDAENLTDDSLSYSDFSVGVDTNGEAVFLFSKTDADNADADIDIYSKTLSNEDLALPLSVTLEVDDIELFEAYLDSLSAEEIEALQAIRYRRGIDMGGWQLRLDGTLNYTDTKASLSLNAAGRGELKSPRFPSIKLEGEARIGGEAGWYVNEDTCTWEFDWGRINLAASVALSVRAEPILQTILPQIRPVFWLTGALGIEIWARFEGAVSAKLNYDAWSQVPFSPTSAEGKGRVGAGFSIEREGGFFSPKTKYTVRGLVNFNFDASTSSPYFTSAQQDPVTASLLFRREYVNRNGTKVFDDVTYSFGGEVVPLEVGGATFQNYTLLNLASGAVVSSDDIPEEEGIFERTITFGEGAAGSLTDLSGEGESAVTTSLTDEATPLIAEAADGTLTGVWVDADGISTAQYVTASQGWTPGGLAIDVGDYEVRDLNVSYDGDGDLMLMWNRVDASGIVEGITAEELDAITSAGGELVFSVLEADTGVWSAPIVLQNMLGNERGVETHRLASGDVLASWVYVDDINDANGELYTAIWNAATDTWSTPELLGAIVAGETPAPTQLDGRPVVIWAQTVDVDGTEETGAALRMVELVDGTWQPIEMDILSTLSTEGSESELFPTSLWNILGDLPEPDQENCEDDDDDDDEDDYDPPVQRPSDPNDILGPDGFGEENWITTEDAYDFKIRFENEPTATAPAQVVVITQEFDTDLNINSFRVDDFGWGDMIFEVDATSPFFTERYDFIETHGFLVDVFAGIDVTTGIATWTISTIDPETGEPPLDADAGFLPINDDTGKGEGFVSYTIAAGRRVDTGTRVDSKARIVFDTEAPIDTPPIFHTLDVQAPTSMVDALPDRADETDVLVSWSAADDEGGSAIGGVDVLVSTNGGAYAVWLDDTTLTKAVWEGEAGNTYSFYSIATDNAGWVEDAPETPDATIAVGAQPGAIAGVVFEDMNGDGVLDDGDVAVSDLLVYIDVNDDGDLQLDEPAVLSDAFGAYAIEGLQPGDYDVRMLLPGGILRTTPGADVTVVTVEADQVSAGPDIGIFRPGSVSGTVFLDGAGPSDGVRDGTETGLSGWTVYIDDNQNGDLDEGETSVDTDTRGQFSFADLAAGTVDIRVVADDAYDLTTPVGDVLVVDITSGLESTGNLFGFKPQGATIAGTKFNDLDGNGKRDAGEEGLQGWKIYIDANANNVLDSGEVSTETDENGDYVLTGLAPGSYIISEVAQDGWVQTFPGAEPFVVNGTVVRTDAVQVALDIPTNALSTVIDEESVASADWADDLTGLSDFRSNDAFADITGSRTTVVTIDSGIDLDHSFFGADADGDGQADRIVFSYDFADGDANASDVSGHGTGIAGIIAGNDDQYGGLAPDADLISLKVFSDTGAGYFADLERALQWVVHNGEDYGVSVVNLSLGDGANWSEATGRYGLGDELAALADMDVIVIAATGNSYASFDTEGVAYPAADPSVIGVGAVWAGDFGGPHYFSNGATDYTTGADRITAFTQRDDQLLDILAPGARFVTAGHDGGLATVQGTSHAAAYMSGVATLAQDLAMREFGHRLSAAEFSALLSQTATFVLDGDDEQDNVKNTGLSLPRVDMTALADAIMAFVPESLDNQGGNGGTGGNGDGALLAAAGQYSVTVDAGETVNDIDFGSFERVSLSGHVFDDNNLDGVRDTGEAGVGGIFVYLDADEDGTLSDGDISVETDETGAWTITGAGPGVETVRVVAPDDIVVTNGEAEVMTSSGTDVAGINFGLDIESDPVSTLTVSEVITTRDGFEVRFSEAIDTTQISVNGALSDVALRNAAGDIVRGSLIFDDDAQGFRFVATRDALKDEDYLLTLSGGADGFVGASGVLDGDADGAAGGDFTVTLAGTADDLPVLQIANVVRAAGQSLAQGTSAPGVPITLVAAEGLTQITFTVGYDADVLNGVEFVASADLPTGTTVSVDGSVDGLLQVTLTLSGPVAQSSIVVGHLAGTVAVDAPAGVTRLLDLEVIATAGLDAVAARDGMHVLALPGDVNLDGAVTAADVALVNQLAQGIVPDDGEGQFDTTLLGDMDGDQDVDLADTMNAFRASLGVYGDNVAAPETGTLDMAGSFGGFDLGDDNGSAVTNTDDPFAVRDPFADPFPTSTPFASPFGSISAFVNPFTSPPAFIDPFAVSTPSVDPVAPSASEDDPFASLSSSSSFSSPFGAFPPFPT